MKRELLETLGSIAMAVHRGAENAAAETMTDGDSVVVIVGCSRGGAMAARMCAFGNKKVVARLYSEMARATEDLWNAHVSEMSEQPKQ